MKHAGKDALEQLIPLLEHIRSHAGIKERSNGVFYKGSKAFLHFHEDPEGLFADLSVNGDWERFAVTTAKEQDQFLKAVKRVLG
jgi:hypothetical protein